MNFAETTFVGVLYRVECCVTNWTWQVKPVSSTNGMWEGWQAALKVNLSYLVKISSSAENCPFSNRPYIYYAVYGVVSFPNENRSLHLAHFCSHNVNEPSYIMYFTIQQHSSIKLQVVRTYIWVLTGTRNTADLYSQWKMLALQKVFHLCRCILLQLTTGIFYF